MGGRTSVPRLTPEVHKGYTINYDGFYVQRLKETKYRLSDSISARTRKRRMPAAPAHSNTVPWLLVEGSDTLGAYYEFFDGTRRVVLVGERHGGVTAGSRNWKRYDEYKDHPTNEVLVKFLEAKKDPTIQTIFLLEESIPEESIEVVLKGGGIFEPLTERRTRSGKVRFGVNPSFDPFIFEEPEEPRKHTENIDYLATQLTRHRRTLVPVDPRTFFLGKLIENFLFYPERLLDRSAMIIRKKDMRGAIERHRMILTFCHIVMKELFDRVTMALSSFEAMFRDNQRLLAMFHYFYIMIENFAKTFNDMASTVDAELFEMFTDYRDLDKITIRQQNYAADMVARLMDFYSVGKILKLPEKSLTVMYAGAAHIHYIARLLILRGTDFELDHVGVFDDKKYTTEPSENSETLRALCYAYREYADSAMLPITTPSPTPSEFYKAFSENAKNIGLIGDSKYWVDFSYVPNCLLFDDPELTKDVLEFADLRVEEVS